MGTTSATLLFRAALGEVLRAARMRRGMTLRQLSAEARVSLGYISEIERGQKEASSELLSALCEALDLPLSEVLRLVSDRVELAEITRRVTEQVAERAAAGVTGHTGSRVTVIEAPSGTGSDVVAAA